MKWLHLLFLLSSIMYPLIHINQTIHVSTWLFILNLLKTFFSYISFSLCSVSYFMLVKDMQAIAWCLLLLYNCFRYEHTKPDKQEELPGPMSSVPLPAASLTLAGDSGSVPSEPAGMSKAERPNVSGGVDWVNAAEFVPGQPYCGRGEWIIFGELFDLFFWFVHHYGG